MIPNLYYGAKVAKAGVSHPRTPVGYLGKYEWGAGGLEIDRDAFALPIAKADRFKAFGAAEFGGRGGRVGGLAAGLGLGQRALGGGRQVFGGWV